MDLNNLSQLHSTDEITTEVVEPDIGASWDAQAWDDIFNTVDAEIDEEVTAS
jgi:hypothetical protein